MANRNGIPKKFVEKVISFLEANDFAAAIKIFNDDDHQKYLKYNSWDLIPVLCEHITKGIRQNNQDLLRCSENFLLKLATEGNPEEGVLEFLDQLDEIDAEKFRIILDCLKILISKSKVHKLRSLEWTLNSVRSCIEHLAKENKFEEFDFHENDNEIILTDDELENAVKFLNCFISFCKHFAEEIKQNFDNDKKEIEILLSSRLLQTYDILFPYINLQIYPELKLIQDKLQALIFQLISNPMDLLKYLFCRALNIMKPVIKQRQLPKTIEELSEIIDDDASLVNTNEIFVHPYEDVIVVSDLAYGMFFFTLLNNENIKKIKVPMVYNSKYVMLSLIYVIVPFLEKKTDIAIKNGLTFLQLLVDQLSDSLEKSDLYFSSHKSILINLNNIMIFSQKEENRKLALICFKKYINSFNWEAKYYLLLRFRPHVTHPGTLGYLVVLFKELISEFLELPRNSETYYRFNKYYKGKLLFDLIKQYCFLTSGMKTDLVENADHIISSLNALLYLFIRDKTNITDIRRYVKKINTDFLHPLAEIVKSSKIYYETKLKNIANDENKKKIEKNCSNNYQPEVEIELSLKNQILPDLTKEQEKLAYQSCMNAVELIDLLRTRLMEFI